MIKCFEKRYGNVKTSCSVLYYGHLNDFEVEKNKAASEYIMTDLRSNIRRHFGIVFVKHVD